MTFFSFSHHVQTKFWAPGDFHPVAGLLLYAGVFCTISTMGSTFVRIIHEASNVEQQGISACNLLCYSPFDYLLLHDASHQQRSLLFY